MTMFAQDNAEDSGVEAVSPLVRATEVRLPVNITCCSFSSDGTSMAMTRGDGRLSLVAGLEHLPGPEDDDSGPVMSAPELTTLDVHEVASTRVAAVAGGFVSAGQDGRVFLISEDGGNVCLIWESGGDWIEALAVHSQSGLVAVAAGRKVVLLAGDGRLEAETELPATVSGLAFDADGRRLAVSHYDGASILALPSCSVDVNLDWRGWHLGVSWSPCGRYLVTTTQEKELHVWDLVTMQDYRIGGYQRKVTQMAWTGNGQSMICSGADVITAWSFAGAGPNGRPPVEIGFVFGGTVTAVSASPAGSLVAGGFSTGNVLVGATGKGEAVVAQPRTGEQISAMAWSPCGRRVAAAGMRGRVNVFTLASDLQVK